MTSHLMSLRGTGKNNMPATKAKDGTYVIAGTRFVDCPKCNQRLEVREQPYKGLNLTSRFRFTEWEALCCPCPRVTGFFNPDYGVLLISCIQDHKNPRKRTVVMNGSDLRPEYIVLE